MDDDFKAEILSVAAEMLAPYRGAYDEFEKFLSGDKQAQGSALVRPLLASSRIEYVLRKSIGHGNAKALGELREVVNLWLEGYSEPVVPARVVRDSEPEGARSKSGIQDRAIERVLKELDYDPDNLPPREPAGKAGLRAAVWAKVKSDPLFAADSVKNANAFRRAWERAIKRGRRKD